MNLFEGSYGSFLGVQIIESPFMVDTVEDWSAVRSPSRAKRRRRQGHPQRIRFISVPKKEAYAMSGGRQMVMHPAMARELRREAAKDQELRETEAFLRNAKPQPDASTPWSI